MESGFRLSHSRTSDHNHCVFDPSYPGEHREEPCRSWRSPLCAGRFRRWWSSPDPASAWKVSGGTSPDSWRYAVEVPLPDGRVVKRSLPSEAVIHLRYATRPGKPWVGISPLGMASETQALAGWIEKRLAEETSTATSYVLPLPEAADVDALKADITGRPW